MIRSQSAVFAYELKRNPKLAEINQNISDYSVDEIMALPYLKWIRQLLLKEKSFLEQAASNSQLMRQNELNIVDGCMPDPMGQMRQWVGEDQYVPLDRGALLVKTGELLWISAKNEIWFDTIKSQNSFALVINNSQFVSNVSKSKYKERYQEKNVQMSAFENNVQNIGPESGPLAQYGVRFSR